MLHNSRRPTASRRSATAPPARTAAPTPGPRPRSPPTHPRCRSRPADRPELRIQRDRPPREMRPDPAPARSANRRSQPRTVSACTPNRPAIRPMPRARDLRLDRRTDHRHLVPTAQQRHIRQQHMRARAPPAPRPPRPQPPIPEPRTAAPAPARAPTGPTPPDTTGTQATRRPAQPRPAPPRRIRSTSGATSGIQESPPDATTKLAGGLSRVYKRAKPANTANPIPAVNSTNTPRRAEIKRRSTEVEVQADDWMCASPLYQSSCVLCRGRHHVWLWVGGCNIKLSLDPSRLGCTFSRSRPPTERRAIPR